MRGGKKIRKGFIIILMTMTYLVMETKFSTTELIYNPMREMSLI
jgi:hypothetical protein